MEQVSKQQPVNKTAFRVLVALSVTHCLNDSLHSVISAVYPLFKDDLAWSFAQIGLITLVYQLSASVFQPITASAIRNKTVSDHAAKRYDLIQHSNRQKRKQRLWMH